MSRLLAVALTCAAVVWAAAVLLVPMRGRGDVPLLAPLVYGAGALVCHQRPERSFHIVGSRLPVCARCAALYLSGAIGVLAGWLGGARAPRRPGARLVASALPVALTVMLEWAGAAAPGNLVRAVSAVPLGGMAGWLFVRMLRAEAPAGQMRYHFLV